MTAGLVSFQPAQHGGKLRNYENQNIWSSSKHLHQLESSSEIILVFVPSGSSRVSSAVASTCTELVRVRELRTVPSTELRAEGTRWFLPVRRPTSW